MISPTSHKKRLLIFILFSVLFIILIPIIVLYSTGYRLSKNLTLVSTGGVYVYYPETGVTVTLKDLPPQKTSIFTKSVLIQNLKPGKYEVDVSREGYSYWKKNVLIVEKRVVEAYPFLVREPLGTSTIPSILKPTAIALFLATTTATSTKKITDVTTIISTSTLGNNEGIISRSMYLYEEKTKNSDELKALWKGESNSIPFYFCEEETKLCNTIISVTISKSPIKHFDFYPGRNDVIIYSNNDGVFVTELDQRTPQNFVTLATGKVDFRVYNGHIYIKELSLPAGKNNIYEVIYD